jgi:hypothetical protein
MSRTGSPRTHNGAATTKTVLFSGGIFTVLQLYERVDKNYSKDGKIIKADTTRERTNGL